MASFTDLTAAIQHELRGLGGRFQVETVDGKWPGQHNLKLVPANQFTGCIDDRPMQLKPSPRPETKFPGASLGPAVLRAIQDRRPVTAVLLEDLRQDKQVNLHDDDHHQDDWPKIDKNATGCGFHDKLPVIIRRFLELDETVSESEIPEIVAVVIGHQTSAARLRQLTKASRTDPRTYAGEHTGKRLVVNSLPNATLDHINPVGDRSFVVDAGSAEDPVKMALLAAATVDVLLPPDRPIGLVIL